MARILYGVAGEGMGHAVRSRVVIEYLKKRHEVKIVAAAKAYAYLSAHFEVEEIDYFKIIYRDNGAANLLTALNNIARFPLILKKAIRIKKLIDGFKPHIIITDFEPLTVYLAKIYDIPVISIDNQHIITDADHGDIARDFKFDEMVTKAVIYSFIIKAKKRFIVSYYNIPSSKKNSMIIPPLIRAEILSANTKEKGHILVYQTSTSNNKLIPVLRGINCQFIIYGLNEEGKEGNITLRKGSEKQFLEDLRTAKAIITNGGFTLISEALYLQKPILSIPVKKQFEQILNALYLRKLGYGMYAKEISKEAIGEFLHSLPMLKKNLKAYKKYSNEKALKKIGEAVILLARPPARSHARSSRRHRGGPQR